MLHVSETMKMNKIDLQNTCMHTGFVGAILILGSSTQLLNFQLFQTPSKRLIPDLATAYQVFTSWPLVY